MSSFPARKIDQVISRRVSFRTSLIRNEIWKNQKSLVCREETIENACILFSLKPRDINHFGCALQVFQGLLHPPLRDYVRKIVLLEVAHEKVGENLFETSRNIGRAEKDFEFTCTYSAFLLHEALEVIEEATDLYIFPAAIALNFFFVLRVQHFLDDYVGDVPEHVLIILVFRLPLPRLRSILPTFWEWLFSPKLLIWSIFLWMQNMKSWRRDQCIDVHMSSPPLSLSRRGNITLATRYIVWGNVPIRDLCQLSLFGCSSF